MTHNAHVECDQLLYLDVSLQRLAHDDFEHVLSIGVIGCQGDRLQQLVVISRLAIFRRIEQTRRVAC